MIQISMEVPNSLAYSFREKLALLHKLHLHLLELDSSECEIESLAPAALCDMQEALLDYGCGIVLYRSSANLSDRKVLRRLFRAAHLLSIPYIQFRKAKTVNEDVKWLMKAAESFGIILLVENRAEGPLSDAPTIVNFLKQTEGGTVGIVFNPLEFVKTKKHPFFQVYYNCRFKNAICCFRMIDGLYETGEEAPLLHGNAELKELVSIALARSFNGFFSIGTPGKETSYESLGKNITVFRSMLKQM